MSPRRRLFLLVCAFLAAAYLAFSEPSHRAQVDVVEPLERLTALRQGRYGPALVGAVDIMPLRKRATAQPNTGTAFEPRSWVESFPARPPSPPPLATPNPHRIAFPYAYVGKQQDSSGWTVFMSQGEELRVLREGDEVDGLFRIDAIRPPSLKLTFLPLNEERMVNIGVSE